MDIVSYRGPSRAGGVSVLIERALANHRGHRWIYMSDCRLEESLRNEITPLSRLNPEVILGHYRYCNEFLWPLMHGLGDMARYNADDHGCYRMLNMAVSAQAALADELGETFVHDYQLALVPEYFANSKAAAAAFFIHIPWPEDIPQEHKSRMAEIARSLLRCRKLGFHTDNYVTNFCRFVEDCLPEFAVFPGRRAIAHESGRNIDLVASPAGVDFELWQTKGATAKRFIDTPYVLSVARADYTKGILENIVAMRLLFRNRPELREKIQLVLVCQPTRNGLAAFDEYWTRCYAEYQDVLAEFATDRWQPVNWITEPLAADRLAGLYAGANAMLVTPKKDGLNLTAKEFVASSSNFRSPLILSRGAGAWHELKDHVITVNECAPDEIALSILRGLRNEGTPSNLLWMKRIVRSNTVSKWWTSMVGMQQETTRADVRELLPKGGWKCNKNASSQSPVRSREN
jgi:trehalose 6-phosphate synthase/phosphatase